MTMSDSSSHSFDYFLNRLKSDPTISRNDLRTVIETLIKIYRNLVTNKDNEKYRTINVKNSQFHRNVWRHSLAQDLLLSCDWNETTDHQSIVFNGSDNDSSYSLTVLVNNREVKPDDKDWVNSGKQFVNPSDEREQRLREEAIKERQKELEEFEKDRKQRQMIGENVKKEIESDNKFRKFKNEYQKK